MVFLSINLGRFADSLSVEIEMIIVTIGREALSIISHIQADKFSMNTDRLERDQNNGIHASTH